MQQLRLAKLLCSRINERNDKKDRDRDRRIAHYITKAIHRFQRR